MRLFISINFDEKTKENILLVQKRLRILGKGRFASPNNLHLTLAFLGEVPEERLQELEILMDEIVVPEMQLTFCEVGTFRNESELWWIGIRQNEKLMQLQSELVAKLKVAGFTPDSKRFRPHITIAREMHIGSIDRKYLLQSSFSCNVSQISLMLSSRSDGKLIYTELYRV